VPWLQVKVDTEPEHAAAVEEALTEAGAVSVTLEDAGDAPILEPEPGTTPLWSATRVIALFEDAADRDRIGATLAGLHDETVSEPVFEQLPDREWERAWMDDWQPLRFGPRLWVAPVDATVEQADAVVVRLDPGLAFGTGTHATTALCLRWLDRLGPAGSSVLDFGCGSGILAIAALRLGARRAHCVDIDPQALEATRANADTNEVADGVDTAEPDSMAAGPFDIVLANILAGPLVQSARTVAARQAAGGRIALAGILSDQAADVVEAYAPWYELSVSAEQDGWVLVSGIRTGSDPAPA